MAEFTSPTVRRVQEALAALGLGHEIVDLGQSARTVADAARAVGCRVDQIAKSLVFRLRESGRPLLVVASGAHRVNEPRVAGLVGAALGHVKPVTTLIDEHLFTFEEIWAAAGHPNTVFRLRPTDLVTMTGGRVTAVK